MFFIGKFILFVNMDLAPSSFQFLPFTFSLTRIEVEQEWEVHGLTSTVFKEHIYQISVTY